MPSPRSRTRSPVRYITAPGVGEYGSGTKTAEVARRSTEVAAGEAAAADVQLAGRTRWNRHGPARSSR